MKIFNVEQIREWDKYTIQEEPISSIDLMERASQAFTKWIQQTLPSFKNGFIIFCGPGNNGGDGLAIARLLDHANYQVEVVYCRIGSRTSVDNQFNYDRLRLIKSIDLINLNAEDSFPAIQEGKIIIDAILGSGLSRPLKGYWEKLVNHINLQPNLKVAVDVPSGLFANQPTVGTSIQADRTLSFQAPKLAFLFPENQDRVGAWDIVNIGLHSQYAENEPTAFQLLHKTLLRGWIPRRKKFSHKGNYGHALLVVGSYGMMGAGVLAARACLKMGVGLLSLHVPKSGYEIMQISVPEAMTKTDVNPDFITELPKLDKYTTIGIGCGIGRHPDFKKVLVQLFEKFNAPLVIDADGLNCLGEHPDLFSRIPSNSILTPHPKEFERLFGKTKNDFERIDLLRRKAQELNVIVILKGAHTAIAMPNGDCYFNSTGNPGMATGGTGDVLTGMLTGLLAQSFKPKEAALLGVFLHGLAGDIALQSTGETSLLASDLIGTIGHAIQNLQY